MSNITRKQWNKYIAILRKINDKAAEDFTSYLGGAGLLDENGMVIADIENMQRDDMLDYAYLISTKYGNASAAISAEMYDAIAILQGAIVPPAELEPVPTFHEVAKTVNGVLKTSHNSEELTSAVGRLVKQTGTRTTMRNAKRDNAQFAWVPSGDTCAFCITLASNGWQNARKTDHKEHIHSNCDCTYAIRFDNKSTVQGYDPDYYYDLYNNTDYGAKPKDKINAMRRKFYQENREEILAQKASAYEKRMELNTPKAEEIKIN